MDQKEYEQAMKKVVSIKPKENYLVIDIYYHEKIILPYKDGIAFLATLANAESYKDEYNKPSAITSFNKDLLKTSIISGEDYINIKIANLLNVSLDEVKEYKLQAA